MNFKHLIAAGILAGCFTACTSDIPDNPITPTPDVPTGDCLYSKIKFTFPGSRSTESEGEEAGQDGECKVGSILVLLATKEGDGASAKYKYLTYAISDAPNITGNTHTIIFPDKETLFQQAGKTVYIFAYCNPPAALAEKFVKGEIATGAEFTDMVDDGDVTESWTSNGFLMTSISLTSKALESAEELRKHDKKENAYDLGSVDVIRACSRFDFRDAGNNLTYSILDDDATVAEGETKPEVAKIKLVNVALFNQSNKFYYLPRVYNAVSKTTTICPTFAGMEVKNDYYILSPADRGWTETLPANGLTHGSADYEKMEWTSLQKIITGQEDIDDGWGNKITPPEDKLGFHIWRYTTENTFIPDADGKLAAPSPANTTGFVFEAEVDPTVTTAQTTEYGYKKGEDTMYVFNNRLYLNAKHLYLSMEGIPVSSLAAAFDKCFSVTGEGKDAVVTVKKGADFESAGFTVLTPDATDKKYYTFYFGYNRHNDNELIYETGPMEFATVRNNIYKLTVTDIKGFGSNKPGDKVEDWNVYFKLNIQVKNWVVRVNNLEF